MSHFRDYGECFCGNRLRTSHHRDCRGCLQAYAQGWPVPGIDAGVYWIVIPEGHPHAGKRRRVRLSHYEQQGSADWQAVCIYGKGDKDGPPGGYVVFLNPSMLYQS